MHFLFTWLLFGLCIPLVNSTVTMDNNNVQILPIPHFVPKEMDDEIIVLHTVHDRGIDRILFFGTVALLLGQQLSMLPMKSLKDVTTDMTATMLTTSQVMATSTIMPTTPTTTVITTLPQRCDPNPCQNNGQCLSDANFVFVGCNCAPGFCGILCACAVVGITCPCQ